MIGFSHWATPSTHGAVEPDNATTFVDDLGILHAGSGGSAPVLAVVSNATTKVLSLWNGSSNNAPPSGWTAISFDDSAWIAAVTAANDGLAYPAGSTTIWSSNLPLANSEQCLFRRTFTLPAGAVVTGCTVAVFPDDHLDGIWVNGSLVAGTTGGPATATLQTFAIPSSYFLAGGSNVIAVWVANVNPIHAYLALRLGVPSAQPIGASNGDSVVLDGYGATDAFNGTTLDTSGWHDVFPNASFSKLTDASHLEVVFNGYGEAIGAGAGTALELACRLVIDSAGTPINIPLGGLFVPSIAGVQGGGNALAGGSAYIPNALAAGAHTVKVQIRPFTESIAFTLLCATSPSLYTFHLQVIEHA